MPLDPPLVAHISDLALPAVALTALALQAGRQMILSVSPEALAMGH